MGQTIYPGTIRIRCPHCMRETHARWELPPESSFYEYASQQPQWSVNRYGTRYFRSGVQAALQFDWTSCPENACRGPFALCLFWKMDAAQLTSLSKMSWHVTPGDTDLVALLEILPSASGSDRVAADLPTEIASEYLPIVELAMQGRALATVSTTCGSVLEQALRIVEQRAVDKGWLGAPLKPGMKLVSRIDTLVEAGVVTKDIGAWAHEVRLLRNEGTHELKGDQSAVRELIRFMDFFFEATFVLPKRLSALRESRADKD